MIWILFMFVAIFIFFLVAHFFLSSNDMQTKLDAMREAKQVFLDSLSESYENVVNNGCLFVYESKENNDVRLFLQNTQGGIKHEIADFNVKSHVVFGTLVFLFDDKNQKFAILNDTNVLSHNNLFCKLISYSDIISVQIIEDGETIFEKSSTIGRALVGGALAGGAGAIVGGLSGKTKQKHTVKNISIKLLLRDIKEPSFTVILYNSVPVDPNKIANIYKTADLLKDIISVIIDRIESEKSVDVSSVDNPDNNNSAIDQLSKLAALLEKGLITEEEFNTQKSKLLA